MLQSPQSLSLGPASTSAPRLALRFGSVAFRLTPSRRRQFTRDAGRPDNLGGSLFRQAGATQSGKISGFGKSPDLRVVVQARFFDLRQVRITRAQPLRFSKLLAGAFGIAFESVSGCE